MCPQASTFNVASRSNRLVSSYRTKKPRNVFYPRYSKACVVEKKTVQFEKNSAGKQIWNIYMSVGTTVIVSLFSQNALVCISLFSSCCSSPPLIPTGTLPAVSFRIMRGLTFCRSSYIALRKYLQIRWNSCGEGGGWNSIYIFVSMTFVKQLMRQQQARQIFFLILKYLHLAMGRQHMSRGVSSKHKDSIVTVLLQLDLLLDRRESNWAREIILIKGSVLVLKFHALRALGTNVCPKS